MKKTQADLAVVAARAAANGRTRPVSRNHLPTDLPTRVGQGPKTRKPRKAWAHRDINGRVSQWHGNPFYFDAVEIDRRWSK